MGKRILSIDIETYSSVPIGDCGSYKYIDSDDFEVLLISYAFDNEDVKCIDLTSSEVPQEFVDALYSSNVLKTAFNASFERVALSKHFGKYIDPSQFFCTMVFAWMAGYAGGLDAVSKAMGFPVDKQKDRAGKALINYFCKPCNPTKANGGRTRNYPCHAPDKWQQFIEYNIQDVVVEREIKKRLSYPVLKFEKELWDVDQRIADRGVRIDTDMASHAVALNDDYVERLLDESRRLTGLENPNSRNQLKEWVENALNLELEAFDKNAVDELYRTVKDETVKRVLKIRKLTSKTSVKKYTKMLDCVCSDGRAHGILQFYGAARTGRWAGRLIQLQNLPGNKVGEDELSEAREILKSGDYELFDMLYEPPDMLSQMIRTALIPSEGCTFLVADYSSAEARCIAWLSDEKWRLDVFAGDGKIYEASASQMFHVPVEQITKGSDLRKKGKVAELACIAEDTLIQTNKGYVPIQKVTTDMKVWDGLEFVEHEGVIYKGKKEVIEYEGLRATEDHYVMVESTKDFIPFGQASDRKIELQRSFYCREEIQESNYYERHCNKSCYRKRNRKKAKMGQICSNKVRKLWDRKMDKSLQPYTIKSGMSCLCNSKNRTFMVIKKNGCTEATMRKSKRQRLQELWRERNKILLQFCIRGLCVCYGECPELGRQKFRNRQNRQRWGLCARKFKNGKSFREQQEQKRYENSIFQSRGMALLAIYSSEKAKARNDKRRNNARSENRCFGKEKELERNQRSPCRVRANVYDIVNCGPRHQYAANGIIVHNCGYGGGVGALKRMGGDSIECPKDWTGSHDDYLQDIITRWRSSSPNIVKLWGLYENAAKTAILEGKTVKVKHDIHFSYKNGNLYIRLPSGRKLSYVDAKVIDSPKGFGTSIQYMGMNQITRKWEAMETYGGHITENIVQALSRDCLAVAIVRLEKEGFPVLFHVHDEAICERPSVSAEKDLERMTEIMGSPIDWAEGLNMRADGYLADFYFKD